METSGDLQRENDTKSACTTKLAKSSKPSDDPWISGEELLTDDSSDEDISRRETKQLHRKERQQRRLLASKRNMVPGTLPGKAELQLPAPLASAVYTPQMTRKEEKYEDDEEEEEIPIVWRPKRGSIKLPQLLDLAEGCVSECSGNRC